MAGWGIIPWGLGGWASIATSISFTDACVAQTTRSVRVRLSAAPLQDSGFQPGSALNPTVWTVQRLDTMVFIQVIAVRVFDPPDTFELLLISPLASHLVQHRVGSTTLRSSSGALISGATSCDFAGLIAADTSTPERQASARGFGTRDLANLPAPIGDSLGGTLLVDASGDYATEEGAALVKKLILRRLITRPGEFFHLPQYGLGVAAKEPMRGGDLLTFRGEIERQCGLEPEIESVAADVSFQNALGILTIKISARLKATGQTVNFPIRVTQAGQVVL